LVKNCGFTPEVAKQIESSYHSLYAVSTNWVQDKLNQASKDGYVTCAFGLRLRTPLLAQVIRGTKQTPREAIAEGRTAGNALGQSWCLLNSRALSEVMQIILKSKYRTVIRPCAAIHDANYFIIEDDLDTLMFLNEHLVRAVNWNDHPDIYHPVVGLGGELSVYYPSWATEIGIPNGANENEIIEITTKGLT
jgi:DNA polymerase-1